MTRRKVHGGQLEIPVGNEVGFKHDPDVAFELEHGPERAAKERAAFNEARRCTCSSSYPDRWGVKAGHKPPCPRAGRRW